MAVFYIEEYDSMGHTSEGGGAQCASQPSLAQQTVAIGASSAQSAVFNPATRFVRLETDAVCSYMFGANPVATAAKPRLSAGQTEYFYVRNPGMKVAVITNT